MLIKKIDPKRPDEDLIMEAAEVLKMGGVVAFPTDTVYGIAAMPFDKKAVEKLYRIKGRKKDKPIALLVSSKSFVKSFADDIPAKAKKLISKQWPGPLTLILHKKKGVPDFLTSGKPSIGIRMPDNAIALEIIKNAGGALAVTSANASGKKAATYVREIRKLKGIDLIFDGGRAKLGTASTIVSFMGTEPEIIRKGPGFAL